MKYKFEGPVSKDINYVGAILIKPDADGNPTESVGIGDEVELSEAEAEALGANYELTKVGSGSPASTDDS